MISAQYGMTALDFAAENGHEETVLALLEWGPNRNNVSFDAIS